MKGINPPKRANTLIFAKLGLCLRSIGLSQVATLITCEELSRLGKGGIAMSFDRIQLLRIP